MNNNLDFHENIIGFTKNTQNTQNIQNSETQETQIVQEVSESLENPDMQTMADTQAMQGISENPAMPEYPDMSKNPTMPDDVSRNIVWKSSSRYDGYEYSISKSQECEIDDVCEIVNAEEILEMWHLFRMPAHDLLQKCFEYATSGHGTMYSLYRENAYGREILGMGGTVPLLNVGNIAAEVWCVGADMTKHSQFIARHSKEILRMLFGDYLVLLNVVGTWNKRSIRWLKYIGFFVEEKPQYMGKNNALFHRFYMTRQMFDKKYSIHKKTKEEKTCVWGLR